eukprot:Nitzschia sp. Nitz4//scaffold109_size72162//23076//24206//NITZ4_005843-RA/size72162-processed-gene-0.29-mRNA-1//-1//CDS//3329532754//7896//frame0
MTMIVKQREATARSTHAGTRTPSRSDMNTVFGMCRQNRWNSVLYCIRSNPMISVTSMTMDNHISTTILHQAITSKGDIKARARVVQEILKTSPQAACIKNGYGSLPLHVIAQRNTKLDASTKEQLIHELVQAYPGALMEQGGVGKRTPLHIIFTDYISPRLTNMMIEHGRAACFMKDKKGFLPAHVACSRHCSPEKLEMLLAVNPQALRACTNSGETLLSLAITHATKSHPNYALIDDLKRRLEDPAAVQAVSKPRDLPSTHQLDASTSMPGATGMGLNPTATEFMNSPRGKESHVPSPNGNIGIVTPGSCKNSPMSIPRKRRNLEEEEMDPVRLLLHFSRHKNEVTRVARV